jgi:hypothetical protein
MLTVPGMPLTVPGMPLTISKADCNEPDCNEV